LFLLWKEKKSENKDKKNSLFHHQGRGKIEIKKNQRKFKSFRLLFFLFDYRKSV